MSWRAGVRYRFRYSDASGHQAAVLFRPDSNRRIRTWYGCVAGQRTDADSGRQGDDFHSDLLSRRYHDLSDQHGHGPEPFLHDDGECAEGERLKAGNGRSDEGGRCAGLVYLVV